MWGDEDAVEMDARETLLFANHLQTSDIFSIDMSSIFRHVDETMTSDNCLEW